MRLEINICIELGWLEPIHILILTQFVILQKQRECEININVSDAIKQYIKEIGLLAFRIIPKSPIQLKRLLVILQCQ